MKKLLAELIFRFWTATVLTFIEKWLKVAEAKKSRNDT